MFEYPSESSLVEEEEEEEYATEVDEKPALFIPRPNSSQNSNAVNSGKPCKFVGLCREGGNGRNVVFLAHRFSLVL